MKKLFAIIALMGVLTLGSTQMVQALNAPAVEQTEQEDASSGGIHKELKIKFIEGS
ncbi:MAG: MotA/TolQ/ExbB proton channel family protein, partial [Candidatus Symbiothrix sp.]|nr:MotA/TolQ/ExbB proton channel family protein [Candidatus Symbiothrix sp.]